MNKALGLLVTLVVTFYMTFVLSAASFNITDWSDTMREGCSMFMILSVFASIGFYFHSEEDKDK